MFTPSASLVRVVADNNALMDELIVSRARITAARAYLDRPGSHPGYGTAHLQRCRDRHSRLLAQLRANRIEALRLLQPDPEVAVPCSS